MNNVYNVLTSPSSTSLLVILEDSDNVKIQNSFWRRYKTAMGQGASSIVSGFLAALGAISCACINCYYAIKRAITETIFSKPYKSCFNFEDDKDLYELDNHHDSTTHTDSTEQKILFISKE